jgi:FkbM family methyltransferase
MIKKVLYYAGSILRLLAGMTRPIFMTAFFLGIIPPRRDKIALRKSKLRFWVRSPMDVWSVKETFLDRFYLRSGISIEEGWTIIDIGAGIGDFAIQAAHRHPGNQVFAFEPFPESFALLQENLQLNDIRNVQAFPHAIAAREGKMQLDLSGGEPLQIQSTHEAKTPAGESLVVDAQSLASFFDTNDIERCHLLKLDCEGAEYPILMQNSSAWLPRVERITLEYHDGLGESSHSQLADYLTGHGFRVAMTPNNVHSNLGYLYAIRSGTP